jgi:hypothetical protein
MGDHKHHERGDGTPHICDDDLFVLVRNPLAKRPTFFVGHHVENGVHSTPFKHQAKKMDAVTAKAWHEFLAKAGHDFFVAVHHEKKPKPSPMKIYSIKGEGSGVRRY